MKSFIEIKNAMDDLDFSIAIQLISRVSPDDFRDELYEHLGYIYKVGNQAVEKNEMLSKRYYRKFYDSLKRMADNGDVKSAHRLAQGYQYGDNIEKSDSKAIAYYLIAAEGGEPNAQFHLGCIYRYGWCGIQKNNLLYERWLDKAVGNNWPEALYEKSKLLRAAGDSINADELLMKASELGFWPANIQRP